MRLRRPLPWIFAVLGLVAATVVVLVLLPSGQSPPPGPSPTSAPPPRVNTHAAAIGSAATSANELRQTLADMGRRSISWNVIYMSDDGQLETDVLDAAAAHGVVHEVVTLEFWSLEHQQGVLRSIAGGAVDANLRHIAQQMRAWQGQHPGVELILRPLHEANLDSYPWGFGDGNANGNVQEDFAPAWDRIWQVMHAEFPGLKFFFCPNGWGTTYDWGVPASEVDYVGHDNYNWSEASGEWHTPDDLLTGTVEKIRGIYPDKPYVIGETGTSEPGPGVTGQSKAQWFTDLARWMSGPAADLGVVAVCYFDHGGDDDWRVYPRGKPDALASRAAFRAAFADIP
jgi:beta-mannanase